MTRQHIFARISCGILFALIAGLLGPAVTLAGGEYVKAYSNGFKNPALIYDISISTAAPRVPPEWGNCAAGPPNIAFTGFISGLAYRQGVLYALEWDETNTIHLLVFDDPVCAAGTRIGSGKAVGVDGLESLAYCSDNDRFYSANFDFGTHLGEFYWIDPSTGNGTQIGGSLPTDVFLVGMTCSSSGDLYAISAGFASRDAAFFSVDRSNGEVKQIGLLGTEPQELQSLHLYGDGNFYSAGNQLHRIDHKTGVATTVPAKGLFVETVWGMGAQSVGDVEGGGGGGDFVINAGMSGSWFDPSHNGEGWLLEILVEETKLANGTKAPGVAVAYWFTYPPVHNKGGDSQQAWFVGVGGVSGNTITFNDAIRPTRGIFGPDFDPEDVLLGTWGDFVFNFSGCDEGNMSYNGAAGKGVSFGSGELAMERITSVDGLDCEALSKGKPPRERQPFSKVTTIDGSMSGSWFDPSHDGEGWLIEILPGASLAVIYWFSYDEDGNEQAWFVGVGSIQGKTITVDAVNAPSGPTFGPGYDPDDVTLFPWGTMSFTFDTCNTGTMMYSSQVVGFGAGTLDLQRITALAGLSCTD